MLHTKLKGMGVALITPFNEDKTIDFEALENFIEFQIENKTDYLVICGTTAETATLSDVEKEEVKRFVADKTANRIPLVYGIGGNNTKEVIETIQTTDLTGYSAILSVTPYYNKPTQEGLYGHYSAIAQSSELPIILYNVPSRTGVNMDAETTLRLAHEFQNIIAIKEASADFTQISKILKDKPDDFMVVSGDDGTTLPLISLGVDGVISVIGNAFPKEFGSMIRLALEGDAQNARKIHYQLNELFTLLFVEGNPAGVKSALSTMGMIKNILRLPLVPTTINTSERIRKVLDDLG